MADLGARVMELVSALARHTDEPGRLTRLYLSPAHAAAARTVEGLMREAGLAARIDPLGTVVGRREGPPGARTLYLGSHIDSVVDAGVYDGPLGVVCGLVALEALAGEALPFAVELLAFGDEENVRFPTNLSTAYALAGRYRPDWLASRDADGVRLADALAAFGGDPARIDEIARDPADALGYLEVHIEQGPALEARGLALGVVTAIAGQTRARCVVTGTAGHAGATPMGLRADALAGAARMVALVEDEARARPEAVATVGRIEARPGAVNVIAAEAAFTLDARAPDDATRADLVAAIREGCGRIAAERGLGFSMEVFADQPAVAMDEGLAAALEAGAARAGLATMRLPSGAGHDAMAMARLCPAAMLFVRCAGGISHNPVESVTTQDADAAARALVEAIRALAARG